MEKRKENKKCLEIQICKFIHKITHFHMWRALLHSNNLYKRKKTLRLFLLWTDRKIKWNFYERDRQCGNQQANNNNSGKENK